jgi:hypothetical protein
MTTRGRSSGGDILDLLQAQRPGQEALDRAMDRALGGPDAVTLGRALRELGARPGVTIVYLVGNHDAALAWDAGARQRLVREFGVHHVALRVQVGVRATEAGRGDVWLLAEHGDALDPHNRRTDPFDPLDSPTGQHFVTEVVKLLFRDHDAKFSRGFDEVFGSEGVKVLRTPIRAPKANAYAERRVQTVREVGEHGRDLHQLRIRHRHHRSGFRLQHRGPRIRVVDLAERLDRHPPSGGTGSDGHDCRVSTSQWQ